MVKSITVTELKARQDAGEDIQLIDVREDYEVEVANIGGEHIPLNTILMAMDRVQKDKPVVVHCRSGKRSAAAIQALERAGGFGNLYNLQGGIIAWAKEIDSSLQVG